MFEILTADEMKQADAATMAQGMPQKQLIDTAGLAVAAQIKKHFDPCPVLFLCGPGNNGADGQIAAEYLKKEGWPVRVATLVKTQGCEVLNSNLSLKDSGLVVDAVFGTGFNKELEPELVTLFDKVRSKKLPVVAVDIPSGVNATTGEIASGSLQAVVTVTFCRRKVAHALQPSKSFCGRIHVAEIGIPDDIVAKSGSMLFLNHPALWLNNFPTPDAHAHKFTRGWTTVYGGAQRTGAACLAAAAAQRVGSGLTTLTCHSHNGMDTKTTYKSYRASIMVDEWATLDDFKALLRDERKNALVLGPGAGGDIKDIVTSALAFKKSGVLDADVFTAFKDSPDELFSKLCPSYVLTPHEGEFDRLFGKIEGNKLDRARAAAKRANAHVLLKGHDTVIAAPDGTAIIHSGAPATLATGGSGDVLAGIIGGLIAQGMNPFMAAACAVWLHAEAAGKHGFGLTPEDIIHNISQVLNKLFQIQTKDA